METRNSLQPIFPGRLERRERSHVALFGGLKLGESVIVFFLPFRTLSDDIVPDCTECFNPLVHFSARDVAARPAFRLFVKVAVRFSRHMLGHV